jgi:hypothetical protein
VGAERFFIVGAQRSGTTQLCRLLDAHPEIEMAAPFRPEPKFFLRDELYARGPAWYDATFFGRKPEARLRGEKTVSYMESDEAARRIADTFPGSRIVFVLRDPIERAVSHYWFSVENGVETLPIEQAFRDDAEGRLRGDRHHLSMSPFAYLRRGRYLDDVARYERVFGRGALRILLYEEVVRDLGPYRDLCRWLGVRDDVEVKTGPRDANLRTDRGEPLTSDLLRWLVEYFTGPSVALGERYGLDLGAWRDSWRRPTAPRR